MPIKKRIDKGRHLDEYRREMLRHGPEAMLLAGCGYLGEVMASHFATATPEQRATIIANMRADWQRHRDRLLAEGGDWWTASFDDGQNRPQKTRNTARPSAPRCIRFPAVFRTPGNDQPKVGAASVSMRPAAALNAASKVAPSG